MWAHPGKQLLFMGAELGQESEWAESRELDWWLLDHPEHLGVHRLMKDLNRAYADAPAIWSRDHEADSFQWIDANDAGRNVFSFIRRGVDAQGEPTALVSVSNFAAIPHADLRLGLPATGEWRELLNTDAATYTGSGVGNLGSVTAVEGGESGQPAHATVVIPPLATVWFGQG
jgi:1,4-alpha-glucan branching enzyme